MSQRDLVAELRAARVEAPSEVRARVRLIAAAAPRPPRRLTWRRALVVVVPAAAAIAAAVVFTRPSSNDQLARPLGPLHADSSVTRAATAPSAGTLVAPPAAKNRVQTYGATLGLRVEHARDVSDGVKRALRIAGSLGGYASAVHAETHGQRAVADLTLKIPREHVQEALARLSQLGTITDENVSTLDRQAQLDATGRLIARLQKRLATLRAEPSTPALAAQIAALVARIERLRRSEADIRRVAHDATVRLHLETPHVVTVKHGHGRLHGVGVALGWLGVGAVYALALGLPVAVVLALVWLVARFVRRRRVDALLSRS